jgi:hypothetical protein
MKIVLTFLFTHIHDKSTTDLAQRTVQIFTTSN